MIRGGHPELVVVDEPAEVSNRLFEQLAPRLLAGRILKEDATFELLGRTWAVLPVDASHVQRGMLAWWPRIFPHCACHSQPDAVQLIDIEDLGPADGRSGARLDQRYGASEGRRTTRAARRRQQRDDAKRRRPG